MRLVGFVAGLASLIPSCSLNRYTLKEPRPLSPSAEIVLYRNGSPVGWGCHIGAGRLLTVQHLGDNLTWAGGPLQKIHVGAVTPSDDVAQQIEDGHVVFYGGDALAEKPWLPLADHLPSTGDRVYYLGMLYDMQPILLEGRYLAKDARDFLVIDGLAVPGSSGACVVNEAGEVIGVDSQRGGWVQQMRQVLWAVNVVGRLWK